MIRRFSLNKKSISLESSSTFGFLLARFSSTTTTEGESKNQQKHHHHSTHVTSSSSTLLPGMVDVSGKALTDREATAIGHIWFPPSVAKVMIQQQQNSENGNNNILEFCTKKGPIFTTATIAATQAAKQTANTIPFCHPIPIRKCKVEWSLLSTVQVKSLCPHHTGAELTVPFEFIEENHGIMNILEKNPKFKPRICHDQLKAVAVMNENNNNNNDNDNQESQQHHQHSIQCKRGSSCPFVHLIVPNNNNNNNSAQKADKLRSNMADFYTHHSNANHQFRRQNKYSDEHFIFYDNNNNNNRNSVSVPQLVNVQGTLVPSTDLELNQAIDYVMKHPLAAIRWCLDGPNCAHAGTGRCTFAHLRHYNNSAIRNYKQLQQNREPHILASLAEDGDKGFRVFAKVTVGVGQWYTGVEMEALNAASVALLTLYDMCKGIPGAVEDGMRLGRVQLIEKIGGKSGHWVGDSVVSPKQQK